MEDSVDSGLMSSIWFGATEKIHETQSHDNRYLGRDLNPRPPEYKAAAYLTRPQPSDACR